MKERYVPIRPGILEHLLRGDLSAFEFGVYVIVHMQADYRTGVWRGSAPRVLNSAPRGAKLREVQRALGHLVKLGLLKHFHRRGQRGNHAHLINKFTVRSGALTGMRLNADKSVSWRTPAYESCAHDDAHDDAQDAPIQEVRKKKEEESTPTAGAAPPADTLESETRNAAFDVFWERWPRRQAKGAARRAWVKIPIAEYPAIIAGVEKFLTCEQWSRGVIPHPASWLNEKRWTDEDIPQVPTGGSTNGRKPSVNDNIESTLRTMRAAEQSRPN